eukprot:GILI01000507.1.p2 GENE.GILI01000507.1~~GILI01000507.1.p2  ORF type:complete len:117 (-),score=32.32 GILI01000507.1:72-422(-)
MVQRLTYRRHCSFNTRSNKRRVVKTPGGKLVYQSVKKLAQGPKCGDCHGPIAGIPRLRPIEYKNLKNRERRVNRAYGGSRCAGCVRERIVRAFLVEEQKIVKRVLKEKAAAKPTKA